MSARKSKIVKCSQCPNQNMISPYIDFITDSLSNLTLCEDCVRFFNTTLNSIKDQRDTKDEASSHELPLPRDIRKALDRNIIKQDKAKDAVSIAIANHYRRMKNTLIKKSNILLIGPSGTGKTEIGRSVATFLKVPFLCVDASNYTARGYQGLDIDAIIHELYLVAGSDIHAAETGIVMIDEIDKIAKKDGLDGGVGTTSVQQQLLKVMEDHVVRLPLKDGEVIRIDTSNILFICAGAFVGLDKIIENNNRGVAKMGFNQDSEKKDKATNKLTSEHLVKFGLIPEFLGRLPVVTQTEDLTEDDFLRILVEPEHSFIKQKIELFKMYNVTLSFSEEFLREVVKEALLKKTGARGLGSVLEERLSFFNSNIHEYQGKQIEIQAGSMIVEKTRPLAINEVIQISDYVKKEYAIAE